MLSLSSTGKDFAESIISCIADRKLDMLSKGAVYRYKELLNWNVWSQKVGDALMNLTK